MECGHVMTTADSIETGSYNAVPVQQDAESLLAKFGDLKGEALLEKMIKDVFPDRLAVASSFGSESVVLLDLVAKVDPSTPILFGNTLKLFPETLAYVHQLVDVLGLTNIQHLKPELSVTQHEDSEDMLWRSNPDRCCEIRKVVPFQNGLEGFDAWVTGRKRFQSSTRSVLPVIEQDGERVKLNPLADWTSDDIQAYITEKGLPEHPLKKHGYLSLGCSTCTRPVKEGEDQRAGRWSGRDKIECGIHFVNGSVVRPGSDTSS